MKHARRAGLYVIENTFTGARYYGSAHRLGARRWRHFYDLRAGQHINPHLQAAWNRYGEGVFVFRVLAVLEKDQARVAEQRLLDRYYGRGDCYNVSCDASHPTAGRPLAAEHRARLSAQSKGKPKSPETRARMSEAAKLRYADPVERERLAVHLRAVNVGRKQSAEVIENRVSKFRGKKHPPERIARRMEKIRGRKDKPEVVEAKRLRALAQWAARKQSA